MSTIVSKENAFILMVKKSSLMEINCYKKNDRQFQSDNSNKGSNNIFFFAFYFSLVFAMYGNSYYIAINRSCGRIKTLKGLQQLSATFV